MVADVAIHVRIHEVLRRAGEARQRRVNSCQFPALFNSGNGN